MKVRRAKIVQAMGGRVDVSTPISDGQRQRGVALLTALLYVSLASIMAVSFVASQQLELRRTGNVLDRDRAYMFALGVEGWVKHVLLRDDAKKDGLDEDWALTLPPITVEGGKVAGKLEDMQGRFNLNNLVLSQGKSAPGAATDKSDESEVNERELQIFQRLLAQLGLDPDIAPAVADWLDKNQDPRFPGGAEDDEYMSSEIPYRAANQLMSSPSELRLVKGVTLETYQQLAPYVTALPEYTQVNVNTAQVPVLAALPGLTADDAELIIEEREKESFSDIAKVRELIKPEKGEDKAKGGAGPVDAVKSMSVKSSWFLLNAVTQYGDRGKMQVYSLLQRKNNKVAVVLRSQGVY